MQALTNKLFEMLDEEDDDHLIDFGQESIYEEDEQLIDFGQECIYEEDEQLVDFGQETTFKEKFSYEDYENIRYLSNKITGLRFLIEHLKNTTIRV